MGSSSKGEPELSIAHRAPLGCEIARFDFESRWGFEPAPD